MEVEGSAGAPAATLVELDTDADFFSELEEEARELARRDQGGVQSLPSPDLQRCSTTSTHEPHPVMKAERRAFEEFASQMSDAP